MSEQGEATRPMRWSGCRCSGEYRCNYACPCGMPAMSGVCVCFNVARLEATVAALQQQVRDAEVLPITAAAFNKADIKANYFADDEFRETVCEMVNAVPDGHWITLIVESLDALTSPDTGSEEGGI